MTATENRIIFLMEASNQTLPNRHSIGTSCVPTELRSSVTVQWLGQGKCSLRIGFAGTENLDVAAASQLTLVRPGHYRFRAFIRTEGVTTDQGIRFRISDAEVPARLDEVFGQFTGSTSWSSVDHDLIVAPETRLVRIEVIRQPSMKFDSKVDGTAWIDQLKLEPSTPHSSR